MRWVTEKQVRAAAKKSFEAAKAMSIKHWKQLVTAKAEELRGARKTNKADVDGYFCAFCGRFKGFYQDGCRSLCPLHKGSNCCPGYSAALEAFDKWLDGKAPITAFRKAGRKLIKRIEECEDPDRNSAGGWQDANGTDAAPAD